MAFGSGLKRAEIMQSVGKPASCWDDIVARELLCHAEEGAGLPPQLPLRRALEMGIFEYIEIFYKSAPPALAAR